ncbi:MAG: hypothetical protein JNL34_01595 [Anaerolineae bacterium]|nr:hypothetical protein [Anaerolineae bacterium]
MRPIVDGLHEESTDESGSLILRALSSRYTDFMNQNRTSPAEALSPPVVAFIAQLQARGLAGPAAALLDAFEPLTILGAQALWIVQPVMGLARASWREAAGDLAATLETAGGVRALRAALRDVPAPPRD